MLNIDILQHFYNIIQFIRNKYHILIIYNLLLLWKKIIQSKLTEQLLISFIVMETNV